MDYAKSERVAEIKLLLSYLTDKVEYNIQIMEDICNENFPRFIWRKYITSEYKNAKKNVIVGSGAMIELLHEWNDLNV